VCGNTLQQVKTFKWLGMVFTSDGSQTKEIDTRIGKANAVLRAGAAAPATLPKDKAGTKMSE